MAEANIEEINKVWSGLGYYCRAKRLKESAVKIMTDHNGTPPQTSEGWKKLPGIGQYTANAIASIVFHEKCGVVDGNVSRVLSRLRLYRILTEINVIRHRMIGSDIRKKHVIEFFWKASNDLVDPERPGDFNQALMELGALICLPKSPKCHLCPLSQLCYVKNKVTKRFLLDLILFEKKVMDPNENCHYCGDIEEKSVEGYPFKSKSKERRIQFIAVCIITRTEDNKKLTLVQKRNEKGLLAGLWEFPSIEITECSYSSRKIQMDIHLHKTTLNSKCIRRDIGTVVHLFSHIRTTYFIESVQANASFIPLCENWKWLEEELLPQEAISTAMRKVWTTFLQFRLKKKKTFQKVLK